jgi:hypothetical protein
MVTSPKLTWLNRHLPQTHLASLPRRNSGPHVRKASHFAVYNNLADVPALADYPGVHRDGLRRRAAPAADLDQREPRRGGVHGHGQHGSGGWYDLTVTASTDASWSQRFVGHLENGQPSITGV